MNPVAFLGKRIDRFVLPVVSSHALGVLKREYDATTAHHILYRSWQAFEAIVARIAEHVSARSRLNMSLAAASAALHEAMLACGIAEARASAMVAEISARTRQKISTPWWLHALTRPLSFGFLLPVRRSRQNPVPPHTLQLLRPDQALTAAGQGTGWRAASRCDRINVRAKARRFSLSNALVIVGAVAALGVGIVEQRTELSMPPVMRESIVVQAESPRLMLSKRVGSHTLVATDMHNQISILVVAPDGSVIPVAGTAQAQIGSAATSQAVVPLVAMNDHLMAKIDPASRGSLNLSLGVDGEHHDVLIELPLPPARRTS